MTVPNQIVILGAGGFIGQALFRLCKQKNVNTLCVSRSFQWSEDIVPLSSSSQFIKSEISDVEAYEDSILPGATVVYMAGSTNLASSEADPVHDFKIHCTSLLTFFNILKKSQKFLFLSSAGTVYGEPLNRHSKETDKLMPKSIYGHRNKILEDIVSSVCSRLGIDYLILRVANPFGDEQRNLRRKGLILSLCNSHSSDHPIIVRGGGNQRRDYILVDDLCDLVFELSYLSSPLSFNVLNVASGVSYSARDVVFLVRSSLGIDPKVEYIAEDSCIDVNNSSIDVSLLRDFLESIGRPNLFKDLSQTISLIPLQNLNHNS